jgi:hypothetical protein
MLRPVYTYLDTNFDEKHVGGRLPPSEDKKDANKLSPVCENERKLSL